MVDSMLQKRNVQQLI